MTPEDREPPAWLGDVGEGVDAWTRGRPDESPGSAGAAGRDSGEQRVRRGRVGRSRWPERAAAPVDEAQVGPEADPESVARTILLDQLTGRARSRRELSDKLAAKDVPEEIAERLLDRFTDVGLVDDGAFARTWVDQRGRSRGRRALQQELRRKGVDAETVAAALEDLEPADEEAAARRLVEKKLRTLSRVDDVTATRRLVGMLARKGYPSGLCFTVVREALAEAGREAPE